jgi:type II secretory pathway component PulJ
MTNRTERGFSTLELIAAVAITAVALIPLAGVQAQLARDQARLSAQQRELTSVNNALAVLRASNPMLNPRGSQQLDAETTLTWDSAPVSPLTPTVNPPGFVARLYRVDAALQHRGEMVTSLQVDILGWRANADGSSRETE